MAQSRKETINTQVSVNYFPRESQWKLRVPLLSLRLAIFVWLTVFSLSVHGSKTHHPQLSALLTASGSGMPGWAGMSLPRCATSAHILVWHWWLWLTPPPRRRGDSILGKKMQYQTGKRENGWSQVCLKCLCFLLAVGLHRKIQIARLLSANHLCDEFWPSVLIACQKLLWEDARHQEGERSSHNWTPASPAGVVVCVKPQEPIQGQAGGETAGTMTCFPSPMRQYQGAGKGGARPGTKTVGYAHVNYCTTERLEIIHVYLYGKYGCFNFAFMLLCHLQRRATPSEAKPMNKWPRKAIQ